MFSAVESRKSLCRETTIEPMIFPIYKHGYHATWVEFEIMLVAYRLFKYSFYNWNFLSWEFFFNKHGNYSLILRKSLKN